MDDKNKIKGTVIILIALGIIAVILLNIDNIKSFNWKNMGYTGLFLVMLITSATVIFPLPGLAAATIAGPFANPIMLGIYGGVGSALGELTGYMIGYGGSEIVDGKMLGKYKELKNVLKRKHEDLLIIFTLALTPNPLFDIVGIAAGAVKYPLWKFMAATTAGKIIKVILFAYLGYFAAGVII